MADPWISTPVPAPDAAVRLYCVPHAGGGGRFFRPLAQALAPAIEVCPIVLPGRESRWQERPYTRMTELLEPLHRAVDAHATGPFAIFGHSMGAAIAYELARRLATTHRAALTRLLVSGRSAPGSPPRLPPVHHLTDEQFLARLRLLGGTPPAVLADTELLTALLPGLRADFELNETYRPDPRPHLDLPVCAYGGCEDPLVDPAELLAWRGVSSGPFTLRTFPGDHFYLADTQLLVGALRTDLLAGDRQAALR